MEFIWDETKRRKVILEHKIDFEKTLDVFDDKDVFDDNFAVFIEDFEHSTENEIRFNVIGKTINYGLVFVVFIYDNSDDIRLVTARKAENWMVNEYEKNRKRL
jgi:uncharacterized DUF497 family protein